MHHWYPLAIVMAECQINSSLTIGDKAGRPLLLRSPTITPDLIQAAVGTITVNAPSPIQKAQVWRTSFLKIGLHSQVRRRPLVFRGAISPLLAGATATHPRPLHADLRLLA